MQIKLLEKILEENNQPAFRTKQIQKAIYQDGISDFSEITTIAKDLRELLDKKIKILSFEAEKILVSSDKRSIKALLKLEDGNLIETVLISPKPDVWSACISSQVGCPLGCGFCATGRGGFKRDLTAEEISDQVLWWRMYLKKNSSARNLIRPAEGGAPSPYKGEGNKVDTIVFMGMGEPFLNWENVNQSLKNLTNHELFGFGSRSISVSTAGIPEGIEKMAAEFPQINLAISLHFPTDEQRNKFMPINRKYNLDELRNSLRNYFKVSNRKVFMEYILLSDINDSKDDADNLIKYLKSMGKLQLLHINLIRYNSTSDELKSSDVGVVREFRDYLVQNGISVTIRKSLGQDIQGACGQLVGEKNKLDDKERIK
jgi:23S rRNA (adenine(2503)-C(2))-methyltransferase